MKKGRPLLILVLISVFVLTVSGSILVTIWNYPKTITKEITITEPTIIPPAFDASIYRTDEYELQNLATTLVEFNDGVSWFKDSCALIHLQGAIPAGLSIRADITVLKNGDSMLIPWSYTATLVCYWRDMGGLHITPSDIFTQDEDESIPDKDHVVAIPTVPSYQNSLGDAPGDPNAIILEFDLSGIVDVGVYSVDIELSILGSE